MYKTTTTRFGKSCTNSLKATDCSLLSKAYCRDFFLPERIYTPVAVQRNLMWAYIYARGSKRVNLHSLFIAIASVSCVSKTKQNLIANHTQ